MEILLEAFFAECKTDEDLPEASWQARIEDSICIQQRVLITLANASHDLREKWESFNFDEWPNFSTLDTEKDMKFFIRFEYVFSG